jgi:hypothetical protein
VAPPTSDVGTIDFRDIIGSQWIDVNEFVPDLMWPSSVPMYARMRTDPKLAAILKAYSLPIRRATWAIDPAGCRDEVVQVVADDLGLPIMGADTTPGPARRRGVSWTEHIRLALLSLVFGFACFERRYEIRNGQARLINLGERMPWTIAQINLNRDGTIASVTQDLAYTTPITANRLVWYANDREGATWTGRSLLRQAYGPWLLKHEMWRVHATSNRRFGMGIPSVEAPPGATPAQVQEAQRLASAMRVGDTAGAGVPHGFKVNLTGLSGSVPNTLEFIKYFDQQMSTMALAGFLDLGQTETGSRALGESFVDLFMLSLQAVADELAAVATSGQPGLTGIVTDLVDLNWGEDEPAPRIRCTDVGERHDLTAQAIGELITAGAITADAALEAYLRDTYRLPPRTATPTLPPTGPATPEPAAGDQVSARRVTSRRRAPGRDRQVRAAGDPAAGHRQLTTIEAASGMDPDAIQALWQTALDKLIELWKQLTGRQREELAEQIKTAVDDDDVESLGDLTADSDVAAEALAEALGEVAEGSAEQLVVEAASQGVTIGGAIQIGLERLAELSRAIARMLASGLADAAGREALRVWAPGQDGQAVADLVTEHLEGLSESYLRDQLGGALSAAQSAGRMAALQEAPEATYVSSEVLDKNTCSKCVEIDGTEFESLAAADAAYPAGLYIDCEGGVRCRGQVIALWEGG